MKKTTPHKAKGRRSAPESPDIFLKKARASLKRLMEKAENQGDRAKYWALWKVDALLSAWLESYA